MPIGSPQWMYASGEDFTLDQSLRSSRGGPNNLSFTPASAGNRKTWTFSCWFKRSGIGAGTEIIFSTPGDYIGFASSDILNWAFATEVDGDLKTTQVFRDPSAWYHHSGEWELARIIRSPTPTTKLIRPRFIAIFFSNFTS